MALNIKNREVETLAAEVAALAHESKTEAIRKALQERKERLTAVSDPKLSVESMLKYMEEVIWPTIPPGLLGKTITKEEEEELLGFGPHGV